MAEALLLALLVAANPALDEGRTLFHQLNYEQALVKLKAATETADSPAERREAYDLLARTWAALGDVKQAEAVYAQLLAKDPLAPPPAEAAPKIRAAYTAAKSALFPPGTVRLTRVAGPAGRLKLQLFDPWNVVAKLEVHEVDGAKDKVKSLEVKPALDFALAPRAEQVWVLALSAKAEVLASLGSKAKPLRFNHSAQPPPPAPPLVAAPDAPRQQAPDAQAKALLEQGRDAEALQAVATARSSGALAREAVLALLGIEACASARLGDSEHAQLAYRKAFAMDPSLPAPDTCEEGWTAWFAARDESKREPLELRALPFQKLPPDRTWAVVQRLSDPLRLTKAVRFHLRRAGGWVDQEEAFQGEQARVEVPAGTLGWWAEVLGEGGTVISLGSPSAPLSPEGEPEKPKREEVKTVAGEPLLEREPEPPKRKWRLKVTVVIGGIGALMAGGAGALGYVAERDRGTLNALPSTTVSSLSQQNAFGLARQQRTEASCANTLWGFAIAFLITATAFFLFGPGGPI